MCGKQLPLEANFTIQFISKMDKLFDIFNSSNIPNDKSYRMPFKNTELQIDHLNMMLSFFEKLRVISVNGTDVTARMNFINGWLIAINGLFMLWDSLKRDSNDKDFVLCTSRLNQDRIENLFGMFRLQNGNNRNPTSVQFYCAFKKLFCLNYFQHSPDANCIKDLDRILCHLNPAEQTNSSSVIFPEETPITCSTGLKIGTVDYRNLDVPESNALTFVCGYLYSKCLNVHCCELCIEYGRSQKDLDKTLLLCYFKAYTNKEKTVFGNLQMPHTSFYDYINELENLFTENFPVFAVEKNVGTKLKNACYNVPFEHPCENFDHQYLIKLFVRFRIFSSVTFLNRDLISIRKLRNRKLANLQHL